MNDKIKIKVKELKSDGTLDSPRFTLSLPETGSEEKQISSSYDALAKLIGASDFIISLDSSLMNLPHSKRALYTRQFLESVRAMRLEYQCSKSTPRSGGQSLFAGFLNKKADPEQEILAYVPNEIWKGNDFKQALPLYGARYFVAKEGDVGPTLLDTMHKMLDEEKLDYFRLILFSVVYFNSIGISAKHLTLPELKSMLLIEVNNFT